jgi:hypothetical protein
VIENLDTAAIDTVLEFRFLDPGVYGFSVECIDEDTVSSGIIGSEDSVTIRAGEPFIDSIVADTTVFINDRVRYTIYAQDNETVLTYQLSLDSTAFTAEQESNAFDTVFASAGVHKLYGKVKDNSENFSEIFVDSVVVLAGTPVVEQIRTDTSNASIFVADERKFYVRARDENGYIRKVYIAYYDKTTADDSLLVEGDTAYIDTPFVHIYDTAESGDGTIRAWVVDEDGEESPREQFDFTLRRGTPVVNGCTVDTVHVFINDRVEFTVSSFDTNGTVLSYYVSLDNGSSYTEYGDSRIDTSFAGEGQQVVSVYGADEDGFVSPVFDTTIDVQLGAPVIDSLGPDTVWVADERTYTVHARDTNGTVDSFRVSFDNSASWLESDDGTVSYAWDTSDAGQQEAVVRVMDDDSVWCERAVDLLVRLGRPAIFGNTFGDSIQYKSGTGQVDTIFYINPSNVNSTVQIDTSDSNGLCRRFFWDWDANSTINTTTTTTTTTSDGFEEGQGRDLIVYCKDDDSLKSNELRLYVYHDALPPTTTTTTTTSQPGMPDVRLAWQGLDVKDDSLTQFAIVIGANSDEISDTVVNFEEANSEMFGISGNWITYTFNPQSRGIESDFYYHIVARDKRGSIPEEINTASVMYPY